MGLRPLYFYPMEDVTMYVLIAIMVVFATIGALSTMMALLNLMFPMALMCGVLTIGLLYAIDTLAEAIE